jgi:hypothetical protein
MSRRHFAFHTPQRQCTSLLLTAPLFPPLFLASSSAYKAWPLRALSPPSPAKMPHLATIYAMLGHNVLLLDPNLSPLPSEDNFEGRMLYSWRQRRRRGGRISWRTRSRGAPRLLQDGVPGEEHRPSKERNALLPSYEEVDATLVDHIMDISR